MNAYAILSLLDRLGFVMARSSLALLWQSSIVLLSAAALSFGLRKSRPAVRFAVVVAALFTLPVLPVLTHVLERVETPKMEIAVLPRYEEPARLGAVTADGAADRNTGPSIAERADAPAIRTVPQDAPAHGRTVETQNAPAVSRKHADIRFLDHPFALVPLLL